MLITGTPSVTPLITGTPSVTPLITGTPSLTPRQQEYLGRIAPERYLARRYNGYTSLDELFNMMGMNAYDKDVTLRNLWSQGGKKHKSRKSKKYRRNRKRNKSRKY